jgi:hypothetical protein
MFTYFFGKKTTVMKKTYLILVALFGISNWANFVLGVSPDAESFVLVQRKPESKIIRSPEGTRLVHYTQLTALCDGLEVGKVKISSETNCHRGAELEISMNSLPGSLDYLECALQKSLAMRSLSRVAFITLLIPQEHKDHLANLLELSFEAVPERSLVQSTIQSGRINCVKEILDKIAR